MAIATGAIYPDLEGRVVLVTGGGSGIGEAMTRAFARQKARTAFIDIAEEPSRALCEEMAGQGTAVHYERCDLTDVDALRAAIERIRTALGPISVLVNNAANDKRHPTPDVTSEDFDRIIAVNLKHQFFCAQAVLDDMKSLGGGSIINMGSVSWMAGVGGMAIYTASKSAVLGLTRSLARDYGAFGVRVNAVAPGWIMTQRQLDLWLTPEAEAQLMKDQCLKRRLVPEDVAKLVLFLASDEAGACTNQQYVVDGGWI